MKNVFSPILLLVVGLLLASGCDLAQPRKKKQGGQPVVQNDPQPVEVPPAPPEQVVPAQGENNMVLVDAAPGMSGKGNYNVSANNPVSIIAVPISTMFRVQDRLVLDQIDYALKLYQAEHGKFPATHEEFWERIILANNFQPNQAPGRSPRLPQLPEGQAYVYDPADGVLKILKPSNAP